MHLSGIGVHPQIFSASHRGDLDIQQAEGQDAGLHDEEVDIKFSR